MKNVLFLVQAVSLLCPVLSRAVIADEPARVAGRWDITIQFVRGEGRYTAFFEQTDERLRGTYRGQFNEGTLEGTVEGKHIRFRGQLKTEGARLVYTYNGTIEGDRMQGKVDLDEYGEADWVARKR